MTESPATARGVLRSPILPAALWALSLLWQLPLFLREPRVGAIRTFTTRWPRPCCAAIRSIANICSTAPPAWR